MRRRGMTTSTASTPVPSKRKTTQTMKRILSVCIGLLAGCAAAIAAAQVGKPAPDFTATDINGKTHRLADYNGKIVVLEAYNLDCPFCANHFKTGAMQELQQWASSKGVVWLLVNSAGQHSGSYRDTTTARKEWDELKIKATAWIDDHDGKLGKLYGMKTTPHMFVIDQKGAMAYQGAIDNRPEPEGDPRKARNYVREAIAKLATGGKIEVKETKSYGCGVKYSN
jgi:peroxiredoxin